MSGFIQRKSTALVVLILAGVIFGGSMTGCGIIKSKLPDSISKPPGIFIDEQEVPLANADSIFTNSTFEIPTLDAPGLLEERTDQAFVDYSNNHDGYVTIGFLGYTDNMLRVLIVVPSGREYIYNLTPGASEIFPLANGNGRYIISVHEHMEGSIFVDLLSITIDVELSDEFAPFIRPNQSIWYGKDCPVTKKALELSLESYNQLDLIKAVYNFVVENITYDFDLAESIDIGYTPDLDKVLETGSGICLDIATLTVAMLRSQGTPAKLVFGNLYDQNHGSIYHAWVSVFSVEDGSIDNNIHVTSGSWLILDPTTETILIASESGVTEGYGKVYHDLYYY